MDLLTRRKENNLDRWPDDRYEPWRAAMLVLRCYPTAVTGAKDSPIVAAATLEASNPSTLVDPTAVTY